MENHQKYPFEHQSNDSGFESAVETACELDRVFFAVNPQREIYIRRAIVSDSGDEFGHCICQDGDELLVIVTRVGDGLRMRRMYPVPAHRVERALRMREPDLRDQLYKKQRPMWLGLPLTKGVQQ